MLKRFQFPATPKKLQQILTTLLLLCLSASGQQTDICHYSCQSCLSQKFDQCLTCRGDYEFTKLLNSIQIDGILHGGSGVGTCMGYPLMEFNILGILMVAALIVLFLLKDQFKTNQSTFLLANWLQTLGLFNFIHIPFIKPLNYLMQSFTPFMPAAMLQKTYNLNESDSQIIEDGLYRLEYFLKSPEIDDKLYISGIITLLALAYIILIPLFIFVRRRLCGEGQCRKCSQRVLRNAESFCYVIYFFMTQQMSLILFSNLRHNASVSSILLTVAFGISFVFMMVNYMFKPIEYFPTRSVLFINLLQKALIPLTLVIPQVRVYMIVGIVAFLLGRAAQMFLNDSRYKNRMKNQKEKYYLYVLGLIGFGLCFGVMVLVEELARSEIATMVLSIVLLVILIVFLFVTFFVEIVEMFQGYRKLQESLEKRRQELIREKNMKSQIDENTLNTLEVNDGSDHNNDRNEDGLSPEYKTNAMIKEQDYQTVYLESDSPQKILSKRIKRQRHQANRQAQIFDETKVQQVTIKGKKQGDSSDDSQSQGESSVLDDIQIEICSRDGHQHIGTKIKENQPMVKQSLKIESKIQQKSKEHGSSSPQQYVNDDQIKSHEIEDDVPYFEEKAKRKKSRLQQRNSRKVLQPESAEKSQIQQ